MKSFRFARLKLRVALVGWFAVIIAALGLIWEVLVDADFIASKWPSKPMPFEFWLLCVGLFWLAFVAFYPELDQAEQPEVGLVWDWSEDEKKLLSRSEFSKGIFVHNRSDVWIHKIEIHPIKLAQEMTFDPINEIAPHDKHAALARWDDKSSITTSCHEFFSAQLNGEAAMKRKWVFTKAHNRGLSPHFFRIPMRVSYEANNRAWESKWNFICDVGDESMFEMVSKRRI
jgi:hypothetical protein